MPLLKGASKRCGTRLYVVSDFHASDPAWRKLLNAIRLNVYKADAVLYAGDLTGKALVLIPGNDDPYDIDEPLTASQYCTNADGTVVDIPGDLQVVGLGKSSPTPWLTPREVSEDALHEEICSLADQVKDPKRTIFLIHCPPYGSGLDTAPVLDENLRLQASAGDLMRGPVGSTGVLEAVRQVRPLLSLHGHIHESAGEKMIGPTLCVNPGSEAGSGVVRGYLIDVSSDGVERSFRVEG